MILNMDCRHGMAMLPDNSVDAIVCDPPYGLSFMGKKWDYDVPGVDIWAECRRVLKPGGYLLAFAGTRTQHRMAVRIEHLPPVQTNFASGTGLAKNGDGSPRNIDATARNPHPTVKPTDLMRYLCRLVTPPGGLIVDPFAGSGSTGKAAILEGFQFVGFELDPEYTAVANARLAAARLAAQL